jgi:hypothetical protein
MFSGTVASINASTLSKPTTLSISDTSRSFPELCLRSNVSNGFNAAVDTPLIAAHPDAPPNAAISRARAPIAPTPARAPPRFTDPRTTAIVVFPRTLSARAPALSLAHTARAPASRAPPLHHRVAASSARRRACVSAILVRLDDDRPTVRSSRGVRVAAFVRERARVTSRAFAMRDVIDAIG